MKHAIERLPDIALEILSTLLLACMIAPVLWGVFGEIDAAVHVARDASVAVHMIAIALGAFAGHFYLSTVIELNYRDQAKKLQGNALARTSDRNTKGSTAP